MVVISAGFNKTHVTTAASEAAVRGLLSKALTGAYPTPRVQQLARVAGQSGRGRAARLLERGEEIPAERVRAIATPELLYEAARAIRLAPGSHIAYHKACAATWRLYGARVARELDRLADRPGVYQFRAGFGHASIDRARARGMHVLCDHAIVHPLLLDELVDHRGRAAALEGRGGPAASRGSLLPTEQAILDDIDRSDSIVVNSHFVKDTFLACGWPEEKIHVVYLGIDDNFLRGVAPVSRQPAPGRLRLLFAGRFERRKGAELICEALDGFGDVDWELVVAGPVMPDIERRHGRFLAGPRVRVLGTIPRDALAAEMRAAAVFVFPSYAEGSARAVFEALACACYVITTVNSGTVVEDGVHGALIPPDSVEALREAIAAADRDRARVAEVGDANAALIAERYQQRDYGDALASLYRMLSP